MNQQKFNKAFNSFLKINQKLADKYGATISIGTLGNMVTVAEPKKKEVSLNNSKDLENKVTTAEKEMSYRDSVEENY